MKDGKLEACELMIGDWVNYRGIDIQVTSLYDKGGSNEIGLGDKESTWVNGCNIDPIPLTTVILAKNGFDEKKRWMQMGNLLRKAPLIIWHYEKDPGYPKHLLEIHHSERNIHARFICEYVHEFQHIMKLLGFVCDIKL